MGVVYTKKSKIAESFPKQNISSTWGYDKAHKANMITKRKSHSSVEHTVLNSAAVSIFVVILVELTNTETVVVSPPRALLNFQKAINRRGVLSGAISW